jgi:DNA primase
VARLPETAVVLLAFDNDAAGKQYATTASADLHGSGRRVEVEFPPESVKDWNNLLTARQQR